MKLIKHTYIGTLLLSIPIVIIGSIFCFFVIKYVNTEETDEYLTYEMQRITDYYAINKTLPEFTAIDSIESNTLPIEPTFSNILLLETGDNEYVPYRELKFSIRHKNENYTIVLRHLLMGQDDIFEGTLIIIIGLIVLVIIFQTLMIQVLNKKLWNPFYRTLEKLQEFKLDKPMPVLPSTNIDEFKDLNKHLKMLFEKAILDYKSNKEFNENASHELQTHLAVIRAKTEQLINNAQSPSAELREIYNTANKLSQIQKSLLLLSKISNYEFGNNQDINLAQLVENTLENFDEAIEIRKIKVEKQLPNTSISIDKGLAEILINNLVKNAIKHNLKNGYINITLNANSLCVENSGLPYNGNPNVLFQRFAKGETGNTGIGLAIVKQICDISHFTVTYSITQKTNHIITVIF